MPSAGARGSWTARSKPEIALEEIDRAHAAGVRFGCVLVDAGHGRNAPFRQTLTQRGLSWAVGISWMVGIGQARQVSPIDVEMIFPVAGRPRPRKRHIPDRLSVAAETGLASQPWRPVTWRRGTQSRLAACFAALRVRGPAGRRSASTTWARNTCRTRQVWVVGESRASGERRRALSNRPAGADLKTLATAITARRSCEQAHQQMKEELGLDHCRRRSWTGLHRHALHRHAL